MSTCSITITLGSRCLKTLAKVEEFCRVQVGGLDKALLVLLVKLAHQQQLHIQLRHLKVNSIISEVQHVL